MKYAHVYVAFICWFFLPSCSVFYVVKQGAYQFSLLENAQPIEKALRASHLSAQVRKKLELIQDVRLFAAQNLHLTINKSYKDVNLDFVHTIYTVSAAESLQFKPYQWWFPIIGSVPYKGFFDEKDAQEEEHQLRKNGFDTQKGEIRGYSTLGFFSDPVWPAMLKMSDEGLIELIIHELTHATAYFPGQTTFNESLANFVGKTGARLYIKNRYGEQSRQWRNVRTYYYDLSMYHDFFYRLYGDLDNLYKSDLSLGQKQIRKIKILDNAHKNYLKLAISKSFKNMDWSRVNNAYLMSFKRYNQDEKLFDDLLAAKKGDFRQFFADIALMGYSKDPFFELQAKKIQGQP